MAHFEVPNRVHSMNRDGSIFRWNTTDGGIGTINSYKFQIGKRRNRWDVYDGDWLPGGPPGVYTDNVRNLTGTGTLWVRAQYKIYGQLYRTESVSFECSR